MSIADVRIFFEQPSISQACSAYLTFLLFLLSSHHLSFSDPYELGGLYWITCLVLGQLTSFAAVYLYSRSAAASEKSATSPNDLWALVGVLEGTFVVFFAIFVAMMAPKFRVSFFSTVTASQFCIRKYQNATLDQQKINVFGDHPSYHESINDEVKQWVRKNLAAWEAEAPEWFTERVLASIPKDMIPERESEEEEKEDGKGIAKSTSSIRKLAEVVEEVVATRRGNETN